MTSQIRLLASPAELPQSQLDASYRELSAGELTCISCRGNAWLLLLIYCHEHTRDSVFGGRYDRWATVLPMSLWACTLLCGFDLVICSESEELLHMLCSCISTWIFDRTSCCLLSCSGRQTDYPEWNAGLLQNLACCSISRELLLLCGPSNGLT